MYSFITVLVVIVSILLILIVLVQNSKGGGLASNFSSSNQMLGVRKTADFLEKATWSLAGTLFVLSFVSVMVIRPDENVTNGIEQELNNKLPVQTEMPNFGAPATENNATEQPAEK